MDRAWLRGPAGRAGNMGPWGGGPTDAGEGGGARPAGGGGRRGGGCQPTRGKAERPVRRGAGQAGASRGLRESDEGIRRRANPRGRHGSVGRRRAGRDRRPFVLLSPLAHAAFNKSVTLEQTFSA